MKRGAWLSDDGVYRYLLTRDWSGDGDSDEVGWLMLNPSTADAEVDDQTVRRCIGFSRAWGYDRLVVANLFAFRTSKPAELLAAWVAGEDVAGPENAAALQRIAECRQVVAAWGAHPIAGALSGGWGRACAARLARAGVEVGALAVTRDGSPRHPARLPGGLVSKPWPGEKNVL